METLDAAARQSVGLPSINHLDGDKVKREEMDYQRKHSAPAMVSPLHPFPGSHSYNNHQSTYANSPSGPLGGLLSPPESRRTSGDEKEQRPPVRQSLPSIHEALGSEQPLSYPPPPPSAPSTSSQSFFPPSSASSPADTRTRNFSVDQINNQGPPNPFSHPRSPFMNKPPPTMTTTTGPPPPPPTSQTDSLPRPSFPSTQHNPKLPTLHPLRTTQSPPVSTPQPSAPFAYPSQPSSAYESSAPRSAGPMNPQYGYSQFPPNYPLSAPPPSGPNSGYPPSAATYSAPAGYPPPSWRSDNSDMGHREEKKRPSYDTYGESVKRHLETFDLEASLNEMAEGNGRIADFTKVYRQRAHENQRIGLNPQAWPRLEEVDDMLKQNEKIQVSLHRIRDQVYSTQQARFAEPPREAHYRPINGYEQEGQNPFHEDAKGNAFAALDTSKRPPKRGRAAPPGRCHSCNRAETPEWRRGPDGARTLCNACGLHYAKLTRKMGGKQTMASSNLRPKSLSDGSPAA